MSTRRLRRLGIAAAILTIIPAQAAHAGGGHDDHGGVTPKLVGRAVLPVNTYAPGQPAGTFWAPPEAPIKRNGVTFPTPSQPVEGFSALISGRRSGEYLAMPDNGFGGKDNSFDFLIRAYYLRPDFKTARGGSGTIDVGDFVQFSDPWHKFGHKLYRGEDGDRMFTGADIDPESLQRDHRGDLWVGDEFGPWILHFDSEGRLLEAPFTIENLYTPNTPDPPTDPAAPNVLGSRGIEAMAITPNGRALIVVLEGAVVGEHPLSRRVYRFDTRDHQLTRLADYMAEDPVRFIADAQALSDDRIVVIERDNAAATDRPVFAVDLAPRGGTTDKTPLVQLAAIPDPDLISLPAIHEGDDGIGSTFRVMCESIESVHVLSHDRLMLTCDNNFPNSGRNSALPDDNEMIVVKLHGR